MNTKKLILDTSFYMFLENGFTEVSINEIIKKAGSTKGGFYHYFKSKEELIEEVAKEYILPFYQKPLLRLKERFDSGEFPGAYEKLMCYYQETSCIDNNIMLNRKINKNDLRNFSLLVYEGVKKYPYIEKMRQDALKNEVSLISQIIVQGKNEKSISAEIDPLNWANIIFALKEGILALNLLDSTINIKEKYKLSFLSIWAEIKNTRGDCF